MLFLLILIGIYDDNKYVIIYISNQKCNGYSLAYSFR